MRDGNASFLIHYLRQHLTKSVYRVLYRTSEMPGMQVSIRAIYFNLPVCQATQTRCDRRRRLAYHRSIAHQDNIGFQHLFMVFQKCLQRWRTYFFLAFKDKLHIALQLPCLRHIFEGLCLNHRLSFIIIRPACIKPAVTNLRLPWIRFPFAQRLHGHHIIMRINQYRRYIGFRTAVFRINERITGRRQNLRFLTTCCQQQFFPSLGTTQHIALVLGLTTHTGNAQKTCPLLHKSLLMSGEVVVNRHRM